MAQARVLNLHLITRNEGVAALKAIIALNESKAFQNGSAIGEATNVGAIVDGTWDSSTASLISS